MQLLQELYVQGNNFSGGLPPSWGNPGTGMPRLRFLFAANNPLGGGRGEAGVLVQRDGGSGEQGGWAVGGMDRLSMTLPWPAPPRCGAGTLPALWGANGSFPELKTL